MTSNANAKLDTSATTTPKAFGSQFFDALKSAGRGSLVTERMKYDQVQKLKRSNRQEAIKFFFGASYETIQHFKNDSPQELAEYMIHEADEAAKQDPRMTVLSIVANALMNGIN